MAAATTATSLTSSAYSVLATSIAQGLIQHRGGGMVRIHVGSSLPAADTNNYLLIGTIGDLFRSFSWSGFTTGDIVYGRADDTAATVVSVVP